MKAGLENGHQTAANGDAGDAGHSWIKYRYIAILIGFIVDVYYNAHRIVMTIGIVAMVNHTAVREEENVISTSCLEVYKNGSVSDSFDVKSYTNRDGGYLWSPGMQGHVLGMSSLCIAVFMIPTGWLTEKIGCKKVLLWSFLFASVFTCITPFAALHSVYTVIVVQSLRGLAQSGILPAECVLVANWCPRTERGFALAFIFSGSCLGAIIGSYITGLLSETTVLGGWPMAFYILGGTGILTCLCSACFMYDNPSVHPNISKSEYEYIVRNQENVLTEKRPPTPWWSLFTSVPVYALGFAHFGQMYGMSYFLSIHPLYLKTMLHYTAAQDGLLSALPFLTQFVTAMITSWLSSFLVGRFHITADKSQKFWNSVSCVGFSCCLLGVYFAGCNRTLSVVFGILSSACIGFGLAGCWITSVSMSPTFCGTLDSICSTIGSMSYFFLPVLVGYMTDKNQTMEQWSKIIFISLGVVMASGITFAIFGSAELQPWNDIDDNQEVVKCKKIVSVEQNEDHSNGVVL